MTDDKKTTEYLDTDTLIKIAQGAAVPVRKMEWGRKNIMHIPVSMWLEHYDIKPGEIPVLSSKLYTSFVEWAHENNMDYVASYNKFMRLMTSTFAMTRNKQERILFISKTPNEIIKKEK